MDYNIMSMNTKRKDGMSMKKDKPYDFSKDYKVLPVKKRVRLIMIARTLLKVQKGNKAILADVPVPQ
jgi:hypothetical protein